MKDLFRIILGLFLIYLFIDWAADNPNSVSKLRSDIESVTANTVEYIKNLSDEGEE